MEPPGGAEAVPETAGGGLQMMRRAMQATPGGSLKGQPKTDHDGEQLMLSVAYSPMGAEWCKK